MDLPQEKSRKHEGRPNPFAQDFTLEGASRVVKVLKDPNLGDNIWNMYALGEELERGEFGITYLCIDKDTEKHLTCKWISKKKIRTAIDIEDVRHEIAIMNSLPKHPTIVSLKTTYEDDSVVHLVMELCEGDEPFNCIAAYGHYTERVAVIISRTIVEVVQVKMIVVLEELGETGEYSLAEALKQSKVQKPVVTWVSGTMSRNLEILWRNNNDMMRTLDALCGAAKLDNILEELKEMGFNDVDMNRKVFMKNDGSIKRAVLDLLLVEKEIAPGSPSVPKKAKQS